MQSFQNLIRRLVLGGEANQALQDLVRFNRNQGIESLSELSLEKSDQEGVENSTLRDEPTQSLSQLAGPQVQPGGIPEKVRHLVDEDLRLVETLAKIYREYVVHLPGDIRDDFDRRYDPFKLDPRRPEVAAEYLAMLMTNEIERTRKEYVKTALEKCKLTDLIYSCSDYDTLLHITLDAYEIVLAAALNYERTIATCYLFIPDTLTDHGWKVFSTRTIEGGSNTRDKEKPMNHTSDLNELLPQLFKKIRGFDDPIAYEDINKLYETIGVKYRLRRQTATWCSQVKASVAIAPIRFGDDWKGFMLCIKDETHSLVPNSFDSELVAQLTLISQATAKGISKLERLPE